MPKESRRHRASNPSISFGSETTGGYRRLYGAIESFWQKADSVFASPPVQHGDVSCFEDLFYLNADAYEGGIEMLFKACFSQLELPKQVRDSKLPEDVLADLGIDFVSGNFLTRHPGQHGWFQAFCNRGAVAGERDARDMYTKEERFPFVDFGLETESLSLFFYDSLIDEQKKLAEESCWSMGIVPVPEWIWGETHKGYCPKERRTFQDYQHVRAILMDASPFPEYRERYEESRERSRGEKRLPLLPEFETFLEVAIRSTLINDYIVHRTRTAKTLPRSLFYASARISGENTGGIVYFSKHPVRLIPCAERDNLEDADTLTHGMASERLLVHFGRIFLFYITICESQQLALIETMRQSISHDLGHDLTKPADIFSEFSKDFDGLTRWLDRARGYVSRIGEFADDMSRWGRDFEVRSQRIIASLSPANIGELRPQLRSIDLRQILTELKEELDRELQDSGVDLSVTLPRRAMTVMGDALMLRKLLGHLIRNAIEAPGTKRIQIVVRPTREGTARVEVCDNGEGVLDADLHRLTQPSFSTKGKGHGYGLAVCSGYARVMRAKFRYLPRGERQSSLEGACFELTLSCPDRARQKSRTTSRRSTRKPRKRG